MHKKNGGFATGLLAAFFLSTSSIFIAALSRNHGVAPLVIAVWRDVITAVALAAILLPAGPSRLRLPGADLAYLALDGALLALFNISWTLSVVRNGAAVATLLVYSSAGFTVLLDALTRRTPLRIGTALAATSSFAGAALVSGATNPAAWNSNALGIAVGLASGLSYALYSLGGKGAAERGIPTWTGLLYSFAFASLFLQGARMLPSALISAELRGPGEFLLQDAGPMVWVLLLLLAAGPTIMGFGLYNRALALLPAGTANILASTEPLFTVVTARIFLGERLSPAAFAGAALILGAVALARPRKLRIRDEDGKDAAPSA